MVPFDDIISVSLVFTFFHYTIEEGNEVGLKIFVEIMDAVEQKADQSRYISNSYNSFSIPL